MKKLKATFLLLGITFFASCSGEKTNTDTVVNKPVKLKRNAPKINSVRENNKITTSEPESKIKEKTSQHNASSSEGCLEILVESVKQNPGELKHLFALAVTLHSQELNFSFDILNKKDTRFVNTIIKSLDYFQNDPIMFSKKQSKVSWEIFNSAFLSYNPLKITSFKLCKSVTSKEIYDEINDYSFGKGRYIQAVAFLPIKGLKPKIIPSGKFETSVKVTFTLTNPNGQTTKIKESESLSEISDKYNYESFIASLIELPPDLKKGKYLLKATIEDLIGLDQLTSSTEFIIKDQPTAAE